jgi:hypothetical protein
MKNLKQLTQFISSGIFSNDHNNLKALAKKFEMYSQDDNHFRIVYGETYDSFGLTIDSLKYYFILHVFCTLLGNDCSMCEVIIGDIASLRNQNTSEKTELIHKEMEENLKSINKIVEKFQLSIKPVRMSQLFEENSFKENFRIVTEKYNQSKEIKDIFEKTVLENRLNQERDSDFLYAREEVALIMNYDFKIGPIREKYYDQVANIVKAEQNSQTLQGIYVKPTYPLGFDFDYFICNPEIETYGITPYKAGSNKLQDHRIIIRDVNQKAIEKLINMTYQPKDITLPNPLQDLYIIADLAKRIANKEYDFSNYNSTTFKKEELFTLLDKYLFSKI